MMAENTGAVKRAGGVGLNGNGPLALASWKTCSAMAKAVADYRIPPTLDLVCHFHFLAAVGGRLLDADHAALRRGLAR